MESYCRQNYKFYKIKNGGIFIGIAEQIVVGILWKHAFIWITHCFGSAEKLLTDWYCDNK